MEWDASYDVLVVGSGAAGLTTALAATLKGLSALVLEKTTHYGGSSALSGGAIWVPLNRYLKEAGVEDTLEEVGAYLDAIIGDRVPASLKKAYLTRGSEMVDFLHSQTDHMRFEYTPAYSDYYPEMPGGFPGGRSVEPVIFDLRKLGDERKLMRRANLPTYGMVMNSYEFHKVNMIKRTSKGKAMSLKIGMRLMKTIFTGYKPAALGEALVARLRLSLKEAGGSVWLSTAFSDFIIENDKVVGLIVERNGKKLRIKARRGVVLGAGGFSHNQQFREKYLPSPTSTSWTSAAEGQTGDIIEASLRAGAKFDLMDKVWGAPSAVPPEGKPFFLVAERGIPNMIVVNSNGERYLNEAAPYHDFIDQMYENDKPGARTVPSWLILDQTARSRYIFMGLFPGQSFPKRWIESGYIKVGNSISELAEKMKVPVNNLVDTVDRFNSLARAGKDEDFQRGDSVYDHYYGDPTLPAPNLAPLEKAPFYAVPIYPGDIGTKGGVVIDENARVLNNNNEAIQGLYAAGNCSAAVMGETYAGPGATLGPAMTFGYIAADHMANHI
ncbi:FAD-dependent oxidoreductase [Bacillus massiliigorillae]|uniref:FAD-dependent oxidoreductase n=1 Tax=Bacillus massiliigorillae TaxID=1243664 RepID=UPI0003A45E25|nr:FAD-dependent oxidoreductase [Bacillus massiliigorillae]